MKRLVTIPFAILMIFSLVSCSMPTKNTSTRKNGLNCAFTSDMTVTIEHFVADGTVSRSGNGMWEAEFTSPNSLSGVKLSFSEGNVTAEYKGLSFSVPQSALPVKAMMLNLIKAVDDNAKLDELKGEEDGNLLKISGSLEGGDYTLSVDKNGCPSSFEMPCNNLTITFSNVTQTGDAPAEAASETTECATEQITEATT